MQGEVNKDIKKGGSIMGEETKDTQVAEDTKESEVQVNEVEKEEKEEKETQKTFTQQEVDKIVKERLERERKANKLW